MSTVSDIKRFFPIFAESSAHEIKSEKKTAKTIAYFMLLALTPYLVPGLDKYQVLVPDKIVACLTRETKNTELPSDNLIAKKSVTSKTNKAVRVSGEGVSQNVAQNSSVNNQAKSSSAAINTTGQTTGQDIKNISESSSQVLVGVQTIDLDSLEAKPGEVEDLSGKALNSFFAKLLQVENKGGQVKISHYGDSPITNDGITSTIRHNLQNQFGDAGHGFVLIDKPWGWYQHAGVNQTASNGWTSDPIAISRKDKCYGLGGVSFTTQAAGVTASFSPLAEGDSTHDVSSFDIYYLAQPNGGDIDIEVDKNFYIRLSTASTDGQTHSAFYQVPVEKGVHKLTLKTVGNGEVRLFGVVLENNLQGVEYDSLGVNGAYISLLANYINPEHWTEQLRHRQPDLVIIGYGTNESQFEDLSMVQYEKDTKETIRRIREALPNASIMLLGPMDRGTRGKGGGIVTRPMIPKLVNYQRRIAAETGCAFFDTYTAMGGDGTVAKWYEMRPRLMGGDFTHPTAQGSEIVGNLIHKAIISAYEKYKSAQLVKQTNNVNKQNIPNKG